MELSMKDLKHVRALLFSIRHKWYDIGIELDLQVAELDIIRSKYDDPADCLLEMLKLWLKSINPLPIWNTLADALRADAVNEVALAEGVASMKEGLLPGLNQPPSPNPGTSPQDQKGGLWLAHSYTFTDHTKAKLIKERRRTSLCCFRENPVYPSSRLFQPTGFSEAFPYLIMSRMTPDEKSRLIAKLEGESKTIRFKFGRLVTTIGQDLHKSDTTVQDIKLFLGNCGLKHVADSFDSSDSVIEVLTKISEGDYWTFFNYELFESMVTTFSFCKSDEVIRRVHLYKAEFKVYCQRRLFEVPAVVFEHFMPDQDSVLKFYVKIDRKFTVSVDDIKNIQHEMSKMLDADPLYLIDVKDGCIELTFGCFKSSEEELFPEEKRGEIRCDLAELKVILNVRCGKYTLNIKSAASNDNEANEEKAQENQEQLDQEQLDHLSSNTQREDTLPEDDCQESDEEKTVPSQSITSMSKGSLDESTFEPTEKATEDDGSSMSVTKKNAAIPAWKFRKLSSHDSYHGAINNEKAKNKLKKQESDCFLTRYSETRDQFTLSVCRRREEDWIFRDFDIVITKEKSRTVYEIRGTEEPFYDIAELLDFYKDKALDNHIDGIGEELVSDPKRTMSGDSQHQAGDSQSSEIQTKDPSGGSTATENVVKALPEWKIKEVGNHPSFHGAIDANAAESLLREQNMPCGHLMRYSEFREEYTLSVLRKKEDNKYTFHSFDIIIEQGDVEGHATYEISGSEKKFSSIAILLDFYKKNPLTHSIDGIGCEIESEKKMSTTKKRSIVDTGSPGNQNVSSIGEEPMQADSHKVVLTKHPSELQNAVPQWALRAMKSHPSFHGSITRIEAVKKLIESGRSCYLTRYSRYNKFCAISTLQMSDNSELLQHLKLDIPQSQDTFKVAGTEQAFKDIPTLLEYYEKHPLNQNGEGCLGECLEAKLVNSSDQIEEPFEVTGTEEKTSEANLNQPTKSNLCCITYKDEEGETHNFKLIEQVSERWFKAGMLLGLSKFTLDKYRDKAENDIKCCEYVFFKWIKNKGHEEYPLTWSGLRTLLIDMSRRTVADNLNTVLQRRQDKKADTAYRVIL